ncbi:MAG: hypothetical protein ACTSPY_08595 [Candidatus Helarchaeota archaeon]
MNSENNNATPKLIYVKWPKEKVLKCPICGIEIKYLYNDGGRNYIYLINHDYSIIMILMDHPEVL